MAFQNKMQATQSQNVNPADKFLLEQDERILWEGEPKHWWYSATAEFIQVIVVLLFMAIAAIITFSIKPKFEGISTIHIILGFITPLVAILVFYISRLKKTRLQKGLGDRYAITNYRVLLHNEGRIIKDIYMDHDSIIAVEITKKRGGDKGTIFFHQPGTIKMGNPFLITEKTASRESAAFKNIENPENVLIIFQRARRDFLKLHS